MTRSGDELFGAMKDADGKIATGDLRTRTWVEEEEPVLEPFMDPVPKVSIGMPVRNGGRYLSDAIGSLLDQSFRDLELIISDNASTDDTPAICRELAAADARVRFFSQPENIGGPANWNFVFEKARGIYFKWASANDICHPTYVERCEEVLRDDPEVVLCYTRTAFLDGEGRIKGEYDGDFEVPQPTPVGRFRRVVTSGSLNNAHQGLIRSAALRRTGLERNYEGGDHPLMAELALMGKWGLVPECLFFRRMARGTHIANLSPEARRTNFYSRSSPIRLPFLRMYLGYLRAGLLEGLSPSQRIGAFHFLLRFGWWHRSKMADDLLGLIRTKKVGRP